MSPAATSTEVKRDAVLVAAVDVARSAAVADAGDAMVGEHLGVVMEGERVATHSFACESPAYVGWRWSVTIARAPRAKVITIDEVVLLPGPQALVAPEWVPWSERIRPGDLGPGDVLPTAPDDPRLIAGLTGEDDLESVAALSPLHPSEWDSAGRGSSRRSVATMLRIAGSRVTSGRPRRWPVSPRSTAPPADSS